MHSRPIFQFFYSFLVFTFLLFHGWIDAKVLVMTHSFNQPEFIPLQYETFKKFLKNDYEFIVFDDAPNEQLSRQIQSICNERNIACVRVPQSIHSAPYYLPRQGDIGGASAECGETVQYMMDTMGFDYDGITLLVDSDMFLIREMDIESFLNDYDIAYIPQGPMGQHGRIEYICPNLMFFNNSRLPDFKTMSFNMGYIEDVRLDTASFTHFYLRQHPDLKKYAINSTVRHQFEGQFAKADQESVDFFRSNQRLIDLITQVDFDYELYLNFHFLHFRAGSNWYQKDDEWINKKKEILTEALKEILKN